MDDLVIMFGLFITSIFGLVGIELLNHNWFRRERFKKDLNFEKKEMDLKLKKMARDLGLDKKTLAPQETTMPRSQPSLVESLRPLLPFLSKLAPEQLEALIDQFLPMPEEAIEELEGEAPTGVNALIDFVSKNPGLIKGFTDKLGSKNATETDNIPSQL